MKKSFLIEAGVKLGLTSQQVNAPNFGFYTINAIKDEMAKTPPLSLVEAFAKYQGLNNIQVTAVTELGLTREQVNAANFGDHTINAIKDIQKRGTSCQEAFEMVRGKSLADTGSRVNSYLTSTKKPQKPIGEMSLIRVVVNTGRGFGHQRAAITLMQKLREMGFNGTFDIHCDDRMGAQLSNTKTGETYINHEPVVSRQLESMIPGFASAKVEKNGIRVFAGLGSVRISSLPNSYYSQDGFKITEVADLAVCAAEDSDVYKNETKTRIFNAPTYIGLQPTDWYQGSCYTIDPDGVVTNLPLASEMRLSSSASRQPHELSSIKLSPTEQKILAIIKNAAINSQLVYGLYPAKACDTESKTVKETGHLDEITEMQLIVEANLVLSKKTGKPVVILLPQKIALDHGFRREIGGGASNVHFVDLTGEDNLNMSEYRSGDVIVAHVGTLQQAFFDHLMLQGTTLPPVIEGCNSVETCESAGRPFIHGSKKHVHLKQYPVEMGDEQKLHTEASKCLETGDKECLSQLERYMEKSLLSDGRLIEYQKQRQNAFLKRPDACETAFSSLGIEYGQRSSPHVELSGKPKGVESAPAAICSPVGVRQIKQASKSKGNTSTMCTIS